MMPATIASTAITTSTMVMIVLAEDRPDALTELTYSSLTDARAARPSAAQAHSSVMTAERYYGRGMSGGGLQWFPGKSSACPSGGRAESPLQHTRRAVRAARGGPARRCAWRLLRQMRSSLRHRQA